MTASKTPIAKGAKGGSALHVVKDRYGEVQRWGELQLDKELPWWYMGQFVVDDTPGADLSGKAQTVMHLSIPARATEEGGGSRDKYDSLGDEVLTFLREGTGKFDSQNKLATSLRAKGVHVPQNDLAPALERLAINGLIEWPETSGRSRPGWLTDKAMPGGEET